MKIKHPNAAGRFRGRCSFLLRAPCPLAELSLANQITGLGCNEGWCLDYVTETRRRWFGEGWSRGMSLLSRAPLTP